MNAGPMNERGEPPSHRRQVMPSLVPVLPETLANTFAERKGKIVLLYGGAPTFRFALMMAARAMKSGGMVAVVDGCNRFDVHALATYARKHRIDPDAFLRRIIVSRGFTCYQIEAAIANRLSLALGRIGSSTAMIFGILDTLYDEQAKLREVQQILERLLVSMQEMKARNISILLACSDWKVFPQERNQLLARLKVGSDHVYRFTVNEQNIPGLFLESPSLRVQAPRNGDDGAGSSPAVNDPQRSR